MQHGVLFENIETGVVKHSSKDWGLIFALKEFSPPTPKTNYLEIEGRNGSLDLSDSLGEIKYNDKEFTLNFSFNDVYQNFDDTISKISNFIHGYRMKITFYNDPDYYFQGRCQISQISTKNGIKMINIKCKTYPYKFRQSFTKKTFHLLVLNNPQKIAIHNEKRKTVPTIYVDRNTNIKFENYTYELKQGKNIVLDILLKEGENIFEVLNTTNITFEYQEASL